MHFAMGGYRQATARTASHADRLPFEHATPGMLVVIYLPLSMVIALLGSKGPFHVLTDR